MMKKMLMAGGILLSSSFAAGCVQQEDTFIFEEEERDATEIEDILSNRMESENPGTDIEVDVYEEVE